MEEQNDTAGAFIYDSIYSFAHKQFHANHGKLCNIKPKQSKRKH